MTPDPSVICNQENLTGWVPIPTQTYPGRRRRPVCNRPLHHKAPHREYDKKTAETISEWDTDQHP